VTAIALAHASTARAQVVFGSDGGRKATLSGYLQTQYDRVVGGSESRDEVFFRRMVLTLDVEPFPDWNTAFQVDLAPVTTGERIVIKDAYLQYTGWADGRVALTIGNQKMPFSRSVLASSSRRHLVERPFPGSRLFGSPGRAIALKLDGWDTGKTRYWAVALASAFHAPDILDIRVDGLAEAERGWDEGWTTAGRFEWHPLGETTRAQGAFSRDGLRVVVGGGAYAWRNDGDRDAAVAAGLMSADAVDGFEISGGMRGGRLSIDAEYEHIRQRARTPEFTGGLYEDGRARVDKAGIEAGWMLIPSRFEIVGALDLLASPALDEPIQRGAGGLNWYVSGHRLKFQFMHRLTRHEGGAREARLHATFLQAQVAF
jgi:hypothetical protein